MGLGEPPAESFRLLTVFEETNLKHFTFLYKGIRKHKHLRSVLFEGLVQFRKKCNLGFQLFGVRSMEEHELAELGVALAWRNTGRCEEIEEAALLGEEQKVLLLEGRDFDEQSYATESFGAVAL